MSRRAKGEGSIWENARGGYDGYYTHQGRRIYVHGKPGESKAEFAGRLRDEIDAARQSIIDYRRQTVAEYMASWLADRVAMDLRPATLRTYSWAVESLILPALGNVRLRDLTPQHVDDAVARWRRKGATAKSAAYARSVLVAALSRAVRKRIIPYNPAALSDVPQAGKPDRRAFSAEEVARFLAAIETDRLRALWIVGLMGGLRISEALGLTWDRVDLAGGRITVDRQLRRIRGEDGGEWAFGPPKTPASSRVAEIPPYAAAALERHRREQIAEHRMLRVIPTWRLVFTSVSGEPLHPSTVLAQLLRIERRAGIPRAVFHELRHTYGMMLRRAGVDLETVMRMMGHASLSVTSGIYGHDQPEVRRAAADALEGLI